MPTLLPDNNATLYRHPLFEKQRDRLFSQPMQPQQLSPAPQQQPMQVQTFISMPQMQRVQPQPMQVQTFMPMQQMQPMQPQPTEVQTWMMQPVQQQPLQPWMPMQPMQPQPIQPQQWSQTLQPQPMQVQTWMMQPQTLMQMPQMQRVQPQQWMPMQPMQPQSHPLPALVRVPPQPMPLQTSWQQLYPPQYRQMPIPMQPVEERVVVQSIHQNPDGTSDCITLPKSKFDQILREKHYNEVPANCDLKYSLTQNNHGQTIYDFHIMRRPETRIDSPQDPGTPAFYISEYSPSAVAVRTIPGDTPHFEHAWRVDDLGAMRGRALFQDGPNR